MCLTNTSTGRTGKPNSVQVTLARPQSKTGERGGLLEWDWNYTSLLRYRERHNAWMRVRTMNLNADLILGNTDAHNAWHIPTPWVEGADYQPKKVPCRWDAAGWRWWELSTDPINRNHTSNTWKQISRAECLKAQLSRYARATIAVDLNCTLEIEINEI